MLPCKYTRTVSDSGKYYFLEIICVSVAALLNIAWYDITNESYKEQFLSMKSGCYNERRGILSADVERASA
jgi:hypothetical protein